MYQVLPHIVHHGDLLAPSAVTTDSDQCMRAEALWDTKPRASVDSVSAPRMLTEDTEGNVMAMKAVCVSSEVGHRWCFLPVIPALNRRKHTDHRWEASLVYRMSPCLNKRENAVKEVTDRWVWARVSHISWKRWSPRWVLREKKLERVENKRKWWRMILRSGSRAEAQVHQCDWARQRTCSWLPSKFTQSWDWVPNPGIFWHAPVHPSQPFPNSLGSSHGRDSAQQSSADVAHWHVEVVYLRVCLAMNECSARLGPQGGGVGPVRSCCVFLWDWPFSRLVAVYCGSLLMSEEGCTLCPAMSQLTTSHWSARTCSSQWLILNTASVKESKKTLLK